jgi:transposase-like protein
MTPAKVRLAAASMQHPETKVSDLCKELGVSRQTLYRYVSPDGMLRESGKTLLKNP